MSLVTPADINSMRGQQKLSGQISLKESEYNDELEEFTSLIEFDPSTENVTIFWENILFVSIIYNYVTFCYFLGLPGFPENIWIYIEFIVEIIMIIDLLIRLILRKMIKIGNRKKFNLLHEKNDDSLLSKVFFIISSIPTSIIFFATLRKYQYSAIWLALIRGLKLYRMKQLNLYFDLQDIRSKKDSFNRTAQASLYILMVTHLLSCFWLFIGRVDPQQDINWMNLVKYDAYSYVPNIQKYIDSVFFVVSSMTGLGFAFIYPRTDLEYAMQSLIMVLGVSLYANFFAFFTVTIYNRNKKIIENMIQFEESKKLAVLRNFPIEIRTMTREYYNSLRLQYDQLCDKFEILHMLPNSLRSEMSLYINSELIQKINFFQFAEPAFILRFSRCLWPELCLQDNYIVYVGEVATKLYFIKSGLVQVLSTDNQTVIAYMSEGSYFGEIGVLLTHKRTVSVKSCSVSILFTVDRDELLQVLNEFPLHMKYLCAVAKQRMKTTKPEDLVNQESEQEMMIKLQEELELLNKNRRESSSELFNKKINLQYSRKIQEEEALSEIYQPTKVKIYLTEAYPDVQEFIIIPLSMRYEIDIERPNLVKRYIQQYFILDILSSVPIDYIMMIIETDSVYIRYFRLLRILKCYRIYETICLISQHTSINLPIFRIALLFIFFIFISHWFNCVMLLFAKWEYGAARRYDGNTLLGWLPKSSPSTLPPADKMSPWQLYFNLIILSVCFMGSIMYGDIIPFTISEETVSIIEMILGRVFIAFLFAEMSSYVQLQYSSFNNHMRHRNLIMKWVHLHDISANLRQRVQRYFDFKWDNQKGIQEKELIKDLPPALENKVQNYIFEDLIQNCDVFPRDNKGAISTITSKLHKQLIPKDEYVIKQGELALSMHFIMKGEVNVVTEQGEVLATLTKYMHFGEMALLQDEISLRTSSIVAVSNVTLARLTVEDFRLICENYPEFKTRMQKIVQARAQDSQKKGYILKHKRSSVGNKFLRRFISIPVTSGQSENQLQQQQNELSMIEEESKRAETPNSSTLNANTQPSPNRTKKKNRKSETQHRSSEAFFISPRMHRESSNKISERRLTYNHESIPKLLNNDENDFEMQQRIDSSVSSSEKTPDESKENEQEVNPNFQDEDETNRNNQMEQDLTTRKLSQKYLATQNLKTTGNLISKEEEEFTRSNTLKDIKRRASSLWFTSSSSNFEEYLMQFNIKHGGHGASFSSMFLFYAFKYLLIFPLTVYNIIFIPFQMGFSILFIDWYLFLEILTLLAYLLDLFFILRHYRRLVALTIKVQPQQQQSQTHKHDRDENEYRLRQARLDLLTSILCIVPFSLILSRQTKPLFILNILRILRLSKILPLYRVLQQLKKYNVKLTRLFEIILSYYIVAHIIAGVMISIGLSEKSNTSDTWMNKIPIPLPSEKPKQTDIDSVSSQTIYIHAIYFAVNTISHVAIGDLTSVNTNERALNTFIIWSTTFFYALLFANISSVFIEEDNFLTFHKKYKHVMQTLPINSSTQQQNLDKINIYYDYLWATSQGFDEQNDILKTLPRQLMFDLFKERFQEAFEQSIIFKNQKGISDISIINSFIEIIKVQIYMPRDFIIKAGSYGESLYFILDGEAIMIGLNNDILGLLTCGSHFSIDLGTGDNSKDDFYGKRLIHLMSQSMTTVGILDKQGLKMMFQAFPFMKALVRQLNNHVHKKAVANLDQYTMKLPRNHNISNFDFQHEAIEKHLTLSDDSEYQSITKILDDPHHRYLYDQKSESYQEINILKQQRAIFENDIGIKSNIRRIRTMRRQTSANMIQFEQLQNVRNLNVPKELKAHNCCSSFSFSKISKVRTLIDFFNMINLIYIAFSVPFFVAFYDMVSIEAFIILESISLFLQLIVVTANFRTSIIYTGGQRVVIRHMFKHYLKNGLIPDLIGLLPINLILGCLKMKNLDRILLYSFLRITRLIAAIRLKELIEKFQIYLKNHSMVIVVFKAFLFLLVLWHWTSCGWYFINQIEDNEITWMKYFSIKEKHLSQQYLLSAYYVIKIVTGVGQSDMIAYNNLERIVFMIIINIGDALFAIAFGLVAQVQMHISQNSEFQQYLAKMKEIEHFLDDISAEDTQRKRIEQYFSYNFITKNKKHLIESNDLRGYLPYYLSKEVIYSAQKEIITPMFADLKSQNLIKELAYMLKNAIYIPGDYIVMKDQIGEEMYFIIEGVVQVIAGDKTTVLKNLGKGDYFGEMAIFLRSKRSAYVQAKTFCIISILQRDDIDEIIKSYPLVAREFKFQAEKRLNENKQLNTNRKNKHMHENNDNLASNSDESENEESVDASFICALKSKFDYQLPPNQIKQSNQKLLMKIQMQSANNPILQKYINKLYKQLGVKNNQEKNCQGNVEYSKYSPATSPKQQFYQKLKVSQFEDNKQNSKMKQVKFDFSKQPTLNKNDEQYEDIVVSDSQDSLQDDESLKSSEENENVPNTETKLQFRYENSKQLANQFYPQENSSSDSSFIDANEEHVIPPENENDATTPNVYLQSNIEEVRVEIESPPRVAKPIPQSLHKSSRMSSDQILFKNTPLQKKKPQIRHSEKQHTLIQKDQKSSSSHETDQSLELDLEDSSAKKRHPSKKSLHLYKQAMEQVEEKETDKQLKSVSIRRLQKKPERRLSKIQMGKNLMISKTQGVRLQWSVGE